ncbi:hypothetical protein H8959_022653 [Pygathrix nigripes]
MHNGSTPSEGRPHLRTAWGTPCTLQTVTGGHTGLLPAREGTGSHRSGVEDLLAARIRAYRNIYHRQLFQSEDTGDLCGWRGRRLQAPSTLFGRTESGLFHLKFQRSHLPTSRRAAPGRRQQAPETDLKPPLLSRIPATFA